MSFRSWAKSTVAFYNQLFPQYHWHIIETATGPRLDRRDTPQGVQWKLLVISIWEYKNCKIWNLAQ